MLLAKTIYPLARCTKFCDVVSWNFYKADVSFHKMPEGAKDKPVISGEFHLSSIAKGLPYGWFLEIPNAKAAAKAYKKYMNSPIDNSQILEAHWFQWPDMFKTVRADGANATCGFVSIIDAPDYALADACAMFPQKCTKGAMVNRHLMRLEKREITPLLRRFFGASFFT